MGFRDPMRCKQTSSIGIEANNRNFTDGGGGGETKTGLFWLFWIPWTAAPLDSKTNVMKYEHTET